MRTDLLVVVRDCLGTRNGCDDRKYCVLFENDARAISIIRLRLRVCLEIFFVLMYTIWFCAGIMVAVCWIFARAYSFVNIVVVFMFLLCVHIIIIYSRSDKRFSWSLACVSALKWVSVNMMIESVTEKDIFIFTEHSVKKNRKFQDG